MACRNDASAPRLAGYRRDDYVVSTKVGRLVQEDSTGPGSRGIFEGVRGEVEWDFSADGVQRSLGDSLERLGMDRIDIALVHDPDDPRRSVCRRLSGADLVASRAW